MGERVAARILISQWHSILVIKRICKIRRVEPCPEFCLARKSLRLALIPAHLKFIKPKIALVRIEVPPEAMPVDVLIENVALKNGALQGQPFPRICRDAHAESAHRIARTTSGNVGIQKSRPSKRAVGEKSAIVGNDEFTVGCKLSNPNGKTRRRHLPQAETDPAETRVPAFATC